MKERERKGNEMQQEIIHTFAVCAYKDSPYLEECLRSVTSQTVKIGGDLLYLDASSYIRGAGSAVSGAALCAGRGEQYP